MILALIAIAIFGLSPLTAGVALGLASIGPHALLPHSLAARALGQPFVLAARALGVTASLLIVRHILPNTLPLTFAHVGSQAGMSVVAYASLALIGLGADPSKRNRRAVRTGHVLGTGDRRLDHFGIRAQRAGRTHRLECFGQCRRRTR